MPSDGPDDRFVTRNIMWRWRSAADARWSQVMLGLVSVVLTRWVLLAWFDAPRTLAGRGRGGNDENDNADEMDSRPLIGESDFQFATMVRESVRQRTQRWLDQSNIATPSTVEQFEQQVGGMSSHKATMLRFQNAIFKPLRSDHRGFRELAFYEVLASSPHEMTNRSLVSTVLHRLYPMRYPLISHLNLTTSQARQLQGLRQFIPNYNGAVHLEFFDSPLSSPTLIFPSTRQPSHLVPVSIPVEHSASQHQMYLVLENVLPTFSKPCIMDIKFGTQTYEPDAPEEKQHREAMKYPEQKQFGFRLVGMRLYDPDQSILKRRFHDVVEHPEYVQYDDATKYLTVSKHFARALHDLDDVSHAVEAFFMDGAADHETTRRNEGAVEEILNDLKRIEEWFRRNDSFGFYASSILFVREGDTNKVAAHGRQTRTALIDLGRIRLQDGGDDGYLCGLKVLKSLLTKQRGANAQETKATME